jgi:elongation factor Ts
MIVSGVLEKYRNTHVLLRQPYIRDETITVSDFLNRTISQIRENIVIRRFMRWEITPPAEE